MVGCAGATQACAVEIASDAPGDIPQFAAMSQSPAIALRRRDVGGGPWLLLGGAFSAFTIAAALMHSYTVYLVAFIAEFGWSRGETSIAYSVSQIVAGISSPFVGALVDRLGPRRLLLLGAALLVLGLLGSSLVTALWQIIALYGFVMTIGANCLGIVVFVPVLSRHFVRRRGMAISILQSANGMARAVSAPLVQLGVSGIGWRSTYLVQAALMALVAVPLAALFRGADQTRRGGAQSVAPAPATAAIVQAAAAVRADWTLAEAARTPHFWLLFAVYLFTGLGSFFVSLHQLAFAINIGFPPIYAAEVLGMGAFLAVFGTIVTGTSSDYIGRELSGILAYGFSIVGVICALLITNPHQHLLLWLHACFFGLTWGARGPAITAKTADLFPGPQLGTILGVITIGTGLGAALGAWGAGWIFDMTGSYRVAFVLSIASYIGGMIAFWAVRRPVRRRA
jgi:MFS family permease